MQQYLTEDVTIVLGLISVLMAVGLRLYRARKGIQFRAKITEELSRVRSEEQARLEALGKQGIVPSLVLSTSTAQAPSGTVEHDAAFDLLRNQLARIAEQFDKKRDSFVEASQINPALEATLTVSIDNLTKRIETLEKNLLTKWDVVTVFLALGGSIITIIGVVVTLVIAALR